MGLDIKEMDHPLPEFSVRQLQNDAKGDKTVTPKQSRFVANVFSMRKRSYDDLVTRHPQAALLYDDPDDGECITVSPRRLLDLSRMEHRLDTDYITF